ncbi:MAG: NACHT domain-containing protein [Candidatus Electronema aureum]|uniref:NACHT domain-containing protein n=1 Tax=Candidatus Electronema aureum TaxID=2005002 RepID=A0A521G4X4_9BACT|nr:MAG: NACHT domain-containing protein [Candidatus Electronema aureum]
MEWCKQLLDGLRSLLTRPDVVWSGIGTSFLVAALTWFFTRLRKPNTASIQHDASDWLVKNRRKFLGRFQRELKDRRQSFLLGHTALELDKNLAPNQVSRPYSFQDRTDCIWERDGVTIATTDQPIVDLFCRPDVGGQLVILGKPGSGKTVCLLTLLEHLLQTAQDNDAAPLPVVFECSEWDGRELSLWMAAQLHRKYHFPEDMARHLVQAHDILPLLDGLDELATEKQGSFVSQFNLFADNRPLVLCCRLEEYRQLRESAGQKLALRNAAILQDITPQRLKGHLLRTGLEDIWTVLEQSRIEAGQQQSLLELAQRPLFLGVMIEVAQDLRQGSGRQPGETWEDFLWRNYLDKRLNVSPPAHGKKYSQQQSLHWLRCLAKWMQAEQKVELWIDELQPSMLKGYWRFGLLYGLFVGLTVGLMGWLFATPVLAASVGLAGWLLIGLPGVLPWQWAVKIIAGLAWGVFGWLAKGPVVGLFCGLLVMVVADNDRIRIEALRPLRLPASWRDGKIFSAMLALWLFFSLAFGLLVGLVLEFVQAGKITPRASMAHCLVVGLFAGLLVGLADGLKAVAGPLNETAHPQQRLKDALRSSLLLFPLFVLAALLLFVQVLFSSEQLGIAFRPLFKMQNFYLFLFAAAIGSFIVLGTNQVLQHYLLRLCLRWEGQLPLRFVSWLEAMQQRKVLQQVGGSYHFLHKQLQEYLAR